MMELSSQQLQQLTQGEMTLLTFECMAALSSSEAKWRELKEQGQVTKLFRNLNGKNTTLRMAMHENLVTTQKAAMGILSHLATEQTMSFSLISSLHEKVMQLQLENDENFRSLYQTLEMVYEDSAEKFKNLTIRVEELEKRLNLLEWQQSMQYMSYNEIPYGRLRNEEKVVCAVNDFYQAVKGEWQQEHEKYVEVMLRDLQLEGELSPSVFYKKLSGDQRLFKRLISNIPLSRPINTAIYEDEPLILLLDGQPVSFDENKEIKKLPVIELALQLLTQLALIEQASRAPSGYELVLASIPHVDERLHINRTLHLEGGIPLEQCRMITNQLPATLNFYESLPEADKLKKALEEDKCHVSIMEVF